MKRWLSMPPASSRHTLTLGSSESLAARAHPAVPPPTTIKSNVVCESANLSSTRRVTTSPVAPANENPSSRRGDSAVYVKNRSVDKGSFVTEEEKNRVRTVLLLAQA